MAESCLFLIGQSALPRDQGCWKEKAGVCFGVIARWVKGRCESARLGGTAGQGFSQILAATGLYHYCTPLLHTLTGESLAPLLSAQPVQLPERPLPADPGALFTQYPSSTTSYPASSTYITALHPLICDL
ncbi:hypothetical protein DPX16_11865 [Anabarilius grahami]|uniref:Uncharacterized protein n=1 Tax=Anabarilius grahami TaxID=495550 RepID=A0A3N0YC68_ANAGA|nr:hypothetical protein DPX16_11865 [Anabarilius grahami]